MDGLEALMQGVEMERRRKKGESVVLQFNKERKIRIDGEEISTLEGFMKYVVPFFGRGIKDNTAILANIISFSKHALELRNQKQQKKQK